MSSPVETSPPGYTFTPLSNEDLVDSYKSEATSSRWTAIALCITAVIGAVALFYMAQAIALIAVFALEEVMWYEGISAMTAIPFGLMGLGAYSALTLPPIAKNFFNKIVWNWNHANKLERQAEALLKVKA